MGCAGCAGCGVAGGRDLQGGEGVSSSSWHDTRGWGECCCLGALRVLHGRSVQPQAYGMPATSTRPQPDGPAVHVHGARVLHQITAGERLHSVARDALTRHWPPHTRWCPPLACGSGKIPCAARPLCRNTTRTAPSAARNQLVLSEKLPLHRRAPVLGWPLPACAGEGPNSQYPTSGSRSGVLA